MKKLEKSNDQQEFTGKKFCLFRFKYTYVVTKFVKCQLTRESICITEVPIPAGCVEHIERAASNVYGLLQLQHSLVLLVLCHQAALEHTIDLKRSVFFVHDHLHLMEFPVVDANCGVALNTRGHSKAVAEAEMAAEKVEDEEIIGGAVIQDHTLAVNCHHAHADVDDVVKVGGWVFVEGVLPERYRCKVLANFASVTCRDKEAK